MHKKFKLIVVLQALIIIVLFWWLVFLGKDEFESYQSAQEEEIEGVNRVSENAGISTVSLSAATQANSGIQTAKVVQTSIQGEIKSFGNVVSIDGLTEAKSTYLNFITELNIAKAASQQNIKQYQRLKALNEDDKNVSDQSVQAALALVNADNAKIKASELQLKNLQHNTELQWGNQLAKLAFSSQLAPHLEKLAKRENVLVQVSLPLNIQTPAPNSTIQITPINESTRPIQAVYVSPATQSDSNGFGKTFYYSAPADSLRIGMRVNVVASNTNNQNNSGVVIPNNAVVWYAGKAWAYFKQGNKGNLVEFVRKPIQTNTEVGAESDGGWFNEGIDANSEVVISGAQLLLSEEFKYLIKNENED